MITNTRVLRWIFAVVGEVYNWFPGAPKIGHPTHGMCTKCGLRPASEGQRPLKTWLVRAGDWWLEEFRPASKGSRTQRG